MNNIISKIINKFSTNIKKLKENADDILELHDNYEMIRVNNEVVFVKNNEIVLKEKDTFPQSPARAAIEGMKLLKEKQLLNTKQSSKDVWTCGFRQNEDRWVWYKNSLPQITASFNDVHSNIKDDSDLIEKKIIFSSINFGISVINDIKKDGIKKAANKINALVLENPYAQVKCSKCLKISKYTIDDLVTENKVASYNSQYIVCNHCGDLLKID